MGAVMAMAATAAPVQAQTLEQALTQAYMTNPALLAARASLQSTNEEVAQALSKWRPDLEFSTSAGVNAYQANTISGVNRHQHRDPKTLDLTITQPLYRGGRTEAATQGAENAVKAERAALQSVEQSVLLEAATAYMDVVRDQAVLKLNINNEQVLKRQLEATQDRFRVGEITRTDVHQAEARLAKSTADRIKAEGDLEVSRAAYLNAVGVAPESPVAPQPLSGIPAGIKDAVQIAVENSPSVIEAEYDEREARDTIKEVRGELLPSVNLSGSASRDFETSGETSRVDSYTAKVTLTVPIYQAGSVYSRLRQAKQDAIKLRRNIEKARRDAVEAATKAWESLQTTRARIESFKALIRAAEVALEGVQREAEVGSRTVLDVLDAEQELLDANVELVTAQRDEIIKVFDLKAALGQLTAKHLSLQVQAYNPETHYNKVRDKWFGGELPGEAEKGDKRQ